MGRFVLIGGYDDSGACREERSDPIRRVLRGLKRFISSRRTNFLNVCKNLKLFEVLI